MPKFSVNGMEFSSSRMPVRRQFHVARKLGAIFPAIVQALAYREKDPLLAATCIAGSLCRIPDVEADFILDACLSIVQLRQGDQWVSIVTPSGEMMFDSINLMTLNTIVWNVLVDHFASFMDALVPKAQAGAAPSV